MKMSNDVLWWICVRCAQQVVITNIFCVKRYNVLRWRGSHQIHKIFNGHWCEWESERHSLNRNPRSCICLTCAVGMRAKIFVSQFNANWCKLIINTKMREWESVGNELCEIVEGLPAYFGCFLKTKRMKGFQC